MSTGAAADCVGSVTTSFIAVAVTGVDVALTLIVIAVATVVVCDIAATCCCCCCYDLC